MIKRRLLYSVPIGLVGLGALLMAIPAGAQATPTVALTVQNNINKGFGSTNANAVAGSNLVTIAVTDTGLAGDATTGDTKPVIVRSSTDSTGVTFNATEQTAGGVNDDGGVLRARFMLSTAASNVNGPGPDGVPGNADDQPQIQVSNGDTVTVIYEKTIGGVTQQFTQTIVVDNTPPTIGTFSPASGAAFSANSLTLAVSASDDRSGFIPNTSGNATAAQANATFSLNVNAADSTGGVALSTQSASVDANGILNASVTVGTPTEQTYQWNVQVFDQAGNVARIDTDAVAPNNQAANFVIDRTGPALLTAAGKTWTGRMYDATNNTEKADRSWIRVLFQETDLISPASVSASDFTVGGVAPESVVVPTKRPVAQPAPYTMNATEFPVYLKMATPLASDAKPVVALVGSVADRAGNNSGINQVTANDGIAPGLTVSVAGDADNRPVAKSSIKVTIVADEDLQQAPMVDLDTFRLIPNLGPATGVETVAQVNNKQSAIVSGSTRTWEVTFSRTEAGGVDGLVNIFVQATDKAANNATKGVQGSPVDISKAILAEFDSVVNGGVTAPAQIFTLSPNFANAINDTDARRPFVQIKFAGEENEYPVRDQAGTAGVLANSFGAGLLGNTSDSAVRVDTHSGITLTKATFGIQGQTGADVLAKVQKTGSNSFLFLPEADLAVGSKYTLTVNGRDDAGNTFATDVSYNFSVVAPKKFEISVVPGWNLISFPDNPQSQGINDVFGANAGVKQVLTYDPNDPTGPWLVAQRGEGGTFSTAQIVNITATRAYWVEATQFETISVTIPRRSVSSSAGGLQPPQIMVKKGWNLVPVIDTAVNAPGFVIDADVYFGTVNWAFAYGYDTATGTWARKGSVVGGPANNTAPDALLVGRAYWLYANADGLLVP